MDASTDLEQRVLYEYIEEIKSISSDFKYRMEFNLKHGEWASHKLLQLNIDPVLIHANFNESERSRFLKLVRKKYGTTKKIKSFDELDWDKIAEDGVGYVIMDDGVRYELED